MQDIFIILSNNALNIAARFSVQSTLNFNRHNHSKLCNRLNTSLIISSTFWFDDNILDGRHIKVEGRFDIANWATLLVHCSFSTEKQWLTKMINRFQKIEKVFICSKLAAIRGSSQWGKYIDGLKPSLHMSSRKYFHNADLYWPFSYFLFILDFSVLILIDFKRLTFK